ncbi:uncharacterized protein METZ01_LOCUS140716, partial [marine metagenome]
MKFSIGVVFWDELLIFFARPDYIKNINLQSCS